MGFNTSKEVMQRVQQFETDFGEVHRIGKRRHEYVYGTWLAELEAAIPEELGQKVAVISRLLSKAGRQVMGIMGHPIEIHVEALDGKKEEADNLEIALAHARRRQDPMGAVKAQVQWHQTFSPYAGFWMNAVPLEIPKQGDLDDEAWKKAKDRYRRAKKQSWLTPSRLPPVLFASRP